MTERGQKLRMLLLVGAVGLAWTGLGYRLVHLHLHFGSSARLVERVQGIREVEQTMLVGRGRVLDRHGSILAADLPVKQIAVDPVHMRAHGHPRFAGYQLSRLLQLDPAMVFATLAREGDKYEVLKTDVPEDLARQIQSMGMEGVICDEHSSRRYPQGALMGHVVGFANAEGTGSAGVEQRLNRYLRGVPGLRVTEVDGRGREVYIRRQVDAQPQQGADVYLTLDQNLQYFVEQALDEAMATNSAKGAWAIVQRVRTGEILAMASRPAYDLNTFNKASDDQRLNRAIGVVYEPGSTFKVAVIAAALNEGLIEPGRVFDCENGLWMYNGRPLRDYHPYGRLTVADVLKKSSNIGAAKIAMLLGEDRLIRYLEAFGIGRRTGVALPGEEAGILNPRSRWTGLSISRVAMGHEVAVTSLQMLSVLSAIANDGYLMRPQVVQRVVTARGQTLLEPAPEVLGRPVGGDTARLLCRLLSRVTEEGGTGTKARLEGYTVAGKTGTAQKPVPGGYSHDANIASFVGFLPAERPELAIIVVVDEPQPLHTGGLVAAPVFRRIAEQAVRYLDIPAVPEEQAWHFGNNVPTVDM